MTDQFKFALISDSSPFIQPPGGEKLACLSGSDAYFCLKISGATFNSQVFIERILIFKFFISTGTTKMNKIGVIPAVTELSN